MASKHKHCAECNSGFQTSPARPDQLFCSAACRKAFNNRRMTRGAALYDLFMATRYQRRTHSGMLAVMSQLANAFREEDAALREGRQSWITPNGDDPRAFEIVHQNIRRAESAEA